MQYNDCAQQKVKKKKYICWEWSRKIITKPKSKYEVGVDEWGSKALESNTVWLLASFTFHEHNHSLTPTRWLLTN